jgi:hypothetical protein
MQPKFALIKVLLERGDVDFTVSTAAKCCEIQAGA